MQLNPYPEYKPTTLPWLANVPKHWELIPNWALLQLKKEVVGERAATHTLLSLTKGGIIERDIENPTGKFPTSFDTYQTVEPGDLIFCLFDMDETPRTIGLSTLHGMVTGAYTRFTCGDDILRRFLFALYFHLDNGKLLKPIYSGLRKVISTNTFLTTKSPIPPKLEQAAIVRFLDHADEQIQRYIAARGRLIALLEEQRQALVHQAVTRGLDPNVRLKPSGVEWLGEVPEHWEVRRIKSLSAVKRGASPRPIDDPKYFCDHGEYAWVRIADVTASNHYLENTTQSLSSLGQSLSVQLQPGSLFMSIAGSVGKPSITKIKCCIHDGFVYFPELKGSEEFLYQVLSNSSPFSGLGKLGTQLNLNTDTVGGIYIAWPPSSERKHITEFLQDSARKFDDAICQTQQQIDLMNEYRTRLIADVVTGQLDVRGTATQLPAAP